MSRVAATGRVGDLGITKALHCYGTADSNIDFGYQTFLDGTPFTMCMRVYPTRSAMTDDGALFSYGYDASTDKGYSIRVNGSSKLLQIFWGSGTNVATSAIRMAGKKYIFVDFNGSTSGRFFENTTLKSTVTMAARTAHATVHTYFGTRDNTARHYAGVIGDGAIYNRLLTDAERAAIVAKAEYPTNGAQIIVRCDENTGTTITDYSGNGRNGTATSILWRNSPFNA